MPQIPARCTPLQREIRAIESSIDSLQELLYEVSGPQKAGIIAMIAQQRQHLEAVREELAACIAGTPSRLEIAGVEHTQAIQFFPFNSRPAFFPPPPDNSVPLVARKSLILRVYVVRRLRQPPVPMTVTGSLSYSQPGGRTFTDLDPISAPITARDSGDIDKSVADHTLNFRVPAAHCVGTLRFTVTAFDPAYGPAGDLIASKEFVVRFREVPEVRVHGVLIHYTGQGLDIPAPTGGDLVDTLAWASRVHPISGFQYTGCDEIEFDGDLSAGGSGCGSGWGGLMTRLRNMRSASGTDDVYLGLLPRGIPSNVAGCGGGGVGAGFDGASTTMAHELGHAYGRAHAPCGNPPNPDPNYPDYYFDPSASIGEFGFDSVTGTVHDPERTFDYMSYCGPRWTSPYTYVGVMNEMVSRAGARSRQRTNLAHDMRERLYLNFRLTRDGAVQLLPSYHLPGPPAAGHGAPTSVFVELRDRQGDTLESRRCNQIDPHQDPDGPYLDFHEVLTWHPAAASIRVRRQGAELGSVDIEPRPPHVRLREQPTTALQRSGTVLRFEWEAGTAPAEAGSTAGTDAATYLVRYSNDGGETWRVVAADLTATSHLLNTDLLAGGERCMVQVVASSGVRTATTESEAFTVEAKPRKAYLLAPQPGTTFRAGQPVVLRGGGFSPEAQTTPFDEVAWSSNRDGPLGVGYEVVVQTLSTGKHRVTMSFPDGLGGEASAGVWIDVQPAT
ncbi:MAG TPA: M66 family metalloprotease [Nocardioidaceae bacterium]|nr:M66 family metalloprotease [Nocardioidaceae bacterium]